MLLLLKVGGGGRKEEGGTRDRSWRGEEKGGEDRQNDTEGGIAFYRKRERLEEQDGRGQRSPLQVSDEESSQKSNYGKGRLHIYLAFPPSIH